MWLTGLTSSVRSRTRRVRAPGRGIRLPPRRDRSAVAVGAAGRVVVVAVVVGLEAACLFWFRANQPEGHCLTLAQDPAQDGQPSFFLAGQVGQLWCVAPQIQQLLASPAGLLRDAEEAEGAGSACWAPSVSVLRRPDVELTEPPVPWRKLCVISNRT